MGQQCIKTATVKGTPKERRRGTDPYPEDFVYRAPWSCVEPALELKGAQEAVLIRARLVLSYHKCAIQPRMSWMGSHWSDDSRDHQLSHHRRRHRRRLHRRRHQDKDHCHHQHLSLHQKEEEANQQLYHRHHHHHHLHFQKKSSKTKEDSGFIDLNSDSDEGNQNETETKPAVPQPRRRFESSRCHGDDDDYVDDYDEVDEDDDGGGLLRVSDLRADSFQYPHLHHHQRHQHHQHHNHNQHHHQRHHRSHLHCFQGNRQCLPSDSRRCLVDRSVVRPSAESLMRDCFPPGRVRRQPEVPETNSSAGSPPDEREEKRYRSRKRSCIFGLLGSRRDFETFDSRGRLIRRDVKQSRTELQRMVLDSFILNNVRFSGSNKF